MLELYCARQGWTFEVVADLRSGINYQKKGLKHLLGNVLEGRVGRLVITHKGRLLRFGAELVFAICEAKGVEVVILNQGEDTTFEEDLANNVLEIVTVFSARLYGSRSRKNQKLLFTNNKASSFAAVNAFEICSAAQSTENEIFLASHATAEMQNLPIIKFHLVRDLVGS